MKRERNMELNYRGFYRRRLTGFKEDSGSNSTYRKHFAVVIMKA